MILTKIYGVFFILKKSGVIRKVAILDNKKGAVTK